MPNRLFQRVVALAGLAGLAAACASEDAILNVPSLENASHVERVLVASARQTSDPEDDGSLQLGGLRYLAYDVSVPAKHVPGRLPSPNVIGTNPATVFASKEAGHYGNVRQLLAAGGGRQHVTVFVHGYRTSFRESVAGLGQMAADLSLPEAPILFAWPSDNDLLSYREDLPRAAAAAAPLAELLSDLNRAGAGRIELVSYSMGVHTVLEALSALQAAGRRDILARTDVVLLAADIDAGEFAAYMPKVSALGRPIVSFGSHRDIALKLVRTVFGGDNPRLGAVTDPESLAGLRLIYVDLAHVRHLGNAHFDVVTSPAMIRAMRAMAVPDLYRLATEEIPRMPRVKTLRRGAMTYMLPPRMQ